MAVERDDYGDRLTRVYAEQLQGMRDGLNAVNRNVLQYIAEGRERGKQIDSMIIQLGVCANELAHLKFWGRVLIGVIAGLGIGLGLGVVALLIKVF
jgi:hypothetical protein